MGNISLFKTHKEEAHLHKTFYFGGGKGGEEAGQDEKKKER